MLYLPAFAGGALVGAGLAVLTLTLRAAASIAERNHEINDW